MWDIVNEPDSTWKSFVVRAARWLRSSARVGARIGVSCAPGMGCLEEFNDNETATDVLLIHPYCAGCFLGGPGESGMEAFASALNQCALRRIAMRSQSVGHFLAGNSESPLGFPTVSRCGSSFCYTD